MFEIKKPSFGRAAICAAVSVFAFALFAAENTYTGASGDGSWFTPSNWSLDSVPTTDDDVVIPAGMAVAATTGAISAKSLTITGSGAKLTLGAYTLQPQTIAQISGDLNVVSSGQLVVHAGRLPDLSVFKDAITDQTEATAAIYAHPTVVSVGGTMVVSGGGAVYPENEPLSGAAVFFKPVNFTLASDGVVDVRGRGWFKQSLASDEDMVPAGARKEVWESKSYTYSYCFGFGHAYNCGAGYGGKAYKQATVTYSNAEKWESGQSYGSAYAPFLSGSMPGDWAACYCRASGSIVVLATGAVILEGTLNADGHPYEATGYTAGSSEYKYGAPSGGGIWVCGKSVDIAETAVLTAKGAHVQNTSTAYLGPGGGGRISVGFDLSSADWDALAASTELPSGYMTSAIAGWQGHVDGGRMNFGNSANKSDDGTVTYVTTSAGKTSLTIASDVEGIISEGVVYGEFVVKTGESLGYSSALLGYDPENPDNVRYSLAGWTLVDNAGNETTGASSPAVFTLDEASGPYTLTWKWSDREIRRYVVKAVGPGTVAINGGDPVAEADAWGEASGAHDNLRAVPDANAEFLGWFGVPGGKATVGEIDVSGGEGEIYFALFSSSDGAVAEKTWVGGTDGVWDDPACWDPQGVPTLADAVKINDGVCSVPQGAFAYSIDVAAGATFAIAVREQYGEIFEDTFGNKASSRFLYVADDFTCAGTAYLGTTTECRDFHIEIRGDFNLTGAAFAEVTAPPCTAETITTNALFEAACAVEIGGALSLAGTSVLSPRCDPFTGAPVRFNVRTLYVAEGASIDASTFGWEWRSYEGDPDPRAVYSGDMSGTAGYETCAFAPGRSYAVSGSHGATALKSSRPTYGFATAPFLPGSPSGVCMNGTTPWVKAGGGVVWIRCLDDAVVEGTIAANGQDGEFGMGAGGSVWLIAAGLETGPSAKLSANGGSNTARGYASPGAGGRICVALGLSDEDIVSLAGGVTPSGVTVTEGIDLIPAEVVSGTERNQSGDGGIIYFPETGTLFTLKGSAAKRTLTVKGSPLNAVGPSPSYGSHPFTPGETLVFTAAAGGFGLDPADPDNVHYVCDGFEVRGSDGTVLTNGTSDTLEYVLPDDDVSVVWIWGEKRCFVQIENIQDPSFGSLKVNGADPAQAAAVWGGPDETVTVEAVPSEGYEFLYWMGEFPYGEAKTNPISFKMSKKRRMSPVFRLKEEPTTRVWTAGGAKVGFDSQGRSTIGTWFDPASWSPANIPGLEDDVVIEQRGDPPCFVTNNYIEVNSLVVTNGGRVYFGVMSDFAQHRFIEQASYFLSRITDNTEELSLVVKGGLVVADGCEVSMGVRTQHAHGRISAGGDIVFSGSARVQMVAGAEDEYFTKARGAGAITAGGNLVLDGTSVLYLSSEPYTGGSVCIRASGVEIAEGASVNAVNRGYEYTQSGTLAPLAPGIGFQVTVGAGYGGYGRYGKSEDQESQISNKYGIPYGNAYAPVHPGSSGGLYGTSDLNPGGGLVRIHAHTMLIKGSVLADASARMSSGRRFSGGSGGGVWLTADEFEFAPSTVISAGGGDTTSEYMSEGGGGRISICRGLSQNQIDALASGGKVRVHAGDIGEFRADFAEIADGAVDVSGGTGYQKDATEPDPDYVARPDITDGTFMYITPPRGSVLLIK